MSKKVLLFVNSKKPEANSLAKKICEKVACRDYIAEVFSINSKTEHYDPVCSAGRTKVNAAEESSCGFSPDNTDLSISLGGDGTVLFASRIMAPLEVPVMPVNLGTLGFIAAVSPSQWEETFSQWEQGKAVISRRLMLNVTVERSANTVFQSCCLNDAVIAAAGIAKLVKLKLDVETTLDDRIDIGHFRADGLIVATPTGSTGYSVAAGGPIMDPEMDAVIVNPICPFTLANRPIVVSSDERIITLVEKEQRSDVILTIDGQITFPLECDDRVVVRRFTHALQLIASDRWAFYCALRTKLEWSGGHLLA
ncbi:MAG: NAD(+)/NADH kinase [Treponema sp.]|nr:NAD(+)/NADH kinase [Treponema sp.]